MKDIKFHILGYRVVVCVTTGYSEDELKQLKETLEQGQKDLPTSRKHHIIYHQELE